MDDSVRIAESTYYHEKDKLNIDHSKIIKRVLELNNWPKELAEGQEEDIERDIITGEVDLLVEDPDKEEAEDEEDDDGPPKLKRWKIENMEVKFTPGQTELVKRLFTKYIDDKLKFPNKPITQADIKEIYYKQMNGLSKNSPFTKLDKFDIAMIVMKVCTLITQSESKKTSMAKKTQAYEEAWMKKSSKKSADNPKL